jgi:hypothetical protein
MYLYNGQLTGSPAASRGLSGSELGRFGATTPLRKTKDPLPKWLQDGVQQGRWKPETASALWALRKISKG